MRILFSLDKKDYKENGVTFTRPSARCIAIKNGKIAMIHSLKYDYYKFPGGGIEDNESPEDALIRETMEEAGLTVIPGTIKEYGSVRRKEKSNLKGVDCFVQDNFYYLCEVEDTIRSQELERYEKYEMFTLEFVDPRTAISVNRNKPHGPKNPNMIEREALVLELLLSEGLVK